MNDAMLKNTETSTTQDMIMDIITETMKVVITTIVANHRDIVGGVVTKGNTRHITVPVIIIIIIIHRWYDQF